MSLSPSETYTLEKPIWTDGDFDLMRWHDVVIHAFTFEPSTYELILDIDYIFAWVDPEPPSPGYSFWVSPATLVFKNMSNFTANLEVPLPLEIMGITRKDPRPPRNTDLIDASTEWTWTIELQQGVITFSAEGYSQHTRRLPIRTSSQSFSLEERGGISFLRT